MSQVSQAFPAPVLSCPVPSSAPVATVSLEAALYQNPDLPRSLEALVSDCFHSIMDPHTLTVERLEYAQKFHKYLADCHSNENLEFLMEIFRYEYFYNRLARAEHQGTAPAQTVSGSLVDGALQSFIDSLPDPVATQTRHKRRDSVKSHSNASFASSAGVPFALEIDEHISPNEAWANFSSQQLSQDSDSESLSGSAQCSSRPVSPLSAASDAAHALLADQWSLIMSTYIADHAECQINLSNKTSRALLESSATAAGPHTPCELMAAKTEVMRLLHENTYRPFTRAMHICYSTTRCDCFDRGSSGTASLMGSPVSQDRLTPLLAKTRDSSGTPIPHSSRPDLVVQVPQSVPENAKLSGAKIYGNTRSVENNSRGSVNTSRSSENLTRNSEITTRSSEYTTRSSEYATRGSENTKFVSTVAPVPQKRRSKLLSTLVGHGSPSAEYGSSSSSTLNNIITHLRPQSASQNTSGGARSYSSAPHSPAPASAVARGISPFVPPSQAELIPRPRSSAVPDGHHSPSLFGKLWKKKR